MDTLTIIFLSLAILFFIGLVFLFLRLHKPNGERQEAEKQSQNSIQEINRLNTLNQGLLAEREALIARYKPIIDAEIEKQKILGDLELNKIRLLGDIRQIEFNHQQIIQILL